MGELSNKLLQGMKTIEPRVKIEKASADPSNGVAKVLFTTNVPTKRSREVVGNSAIMEAAFAKVLGDKAHLVTASIHPSEEAGMYVAYVKLNAPRVAHADAIKENSGFHLVAANVFADDSDNIWEVKEDASGNRILLRNAQEDLTELLTQVAPSANMSVAAASVNLSSKLEFASLVTSFDPESEEYHHGVVLDTAHVYDFADKKIKKSSGALAIAGTESFAEIRMNLNKRMGDAVATIPELSAAKVSDVIQYLDTLYQNNPVFLAAYKSAVLGLIKI